ncbi:unnamed protein product [Toxocara canis]|uniref:Secreted protein n=1 Tax=Toxocara canis TaxID=6265 RepID=A0A183UKX4_TOXCA|nr:unnamed protein product [Toxocara canis]
MRRGRTAATSVTAVSGHVCCVRLPPTASASLTNKRVCRARVEEPAERLGRQAATQLHEALVAVRRI